VRSRLKFFVGATLIAAAATAGSTPATAYDAPGSSDFIQISTGTSAIGACNFLFSGPSLDPSSTPYRITGNATIVSGRVVASTTIRCRLRLATGTKPQVGAALARALPLNNSVVAGDVNVSSFGPFELCTLIDAVFSDDGSRYNPGNTEYCRPLTRV
jgi:hypothetical protein